VNGIEREYRGQLNVVYVSMDQHAGKELARQHGVVGTPTILLLDGEGDRVSVMQGLLPSALIEQAIQDMLAQ
jgi:thioredoxin-like negative regulator of GroEL